MPNQTVGKKRPKKIKLPQMNFFLEKQIIKFHVPISHFHSAKFKKIIRANLELWGCAIFRPKIAQFVLNKFFLVQTIIINFIYLLALFIVQNLKKFLQRIQSYEDAQFLGPKWPISPNEMFF